jgi:citrate lyase subunit beta / citryl-CoA lyase
MAAPPSASSPIRPIRRQASAFHAITNCNRVTVIESARTFLMRSKLFVPGSRPELFEKAMRSAADAISFDLEDAVVAESKAKARAYVEEAIGRAVGASGKTIIVRVNSVDGPLFEADLEAIVRPGLDVVNLPKIENAQAVHRASDILKRLERERGLDRRIGVLANIETPRGLRNAAEIAASSDRIVGLQLGFGDLFEPLGIERSLATLTPIWLAVRLAAAESGVPAYDGAFVGLSDLAAFRAEATAARAVGLAGKSCVHPTQIEVANAVFLPSAAEIERARRIVSAADEMLARGVGAFTVEGVMADGPFILRAREVLRMAEFARSDV